jgi:hypothetical protein
MMDSKSKDGADFA